MAKKYFLLLAFVFIAFFVLPKNAFCIDNPEEYLKNQDKIQLKEKESKNIIFSLKQKLADEWISATASAFSEPEEQAIIVILRKAVFADSLKYLAVDVPKNLAFQIAKTGFKIGKIMYSGGLDDLVGEFEKLTVNEAKKYAIEWLLQNDLKYSTGNIPFSYTTYTEKKQQITLPYIIVYQPIDNKKGEVAISFYSSKSIEPPSPDGISAYLSDFWYMKEWLNKGDKEFSPFIVRLKGEIEKQSNDEYRWTEGPEFEFVFDEPVPEFDFKEPGLAQKAVNYVNEQIIVLEKIRQLVEKVSKQAEETSGKVSQSIFDRIKSFITSTILKGEVGGNITKEEVKENIQEPIKELSENIQQQEVAQEESHVKTSGENSSPPEDLLKIQDLSEMQETINNISETIASLNNQKTVPIEEKKTEQKPLSSPVYLVGSAPTSREPEQTKPEQTKTEENKKEPEKEPEKPKDIIPPQISFNLQSEQSFVDFKVNFEITDSATSSGLEGFYFRKKEGEGDWIENEYKTIEGNLEKYQGEIQIAGEDGKTYYFQVKAKDKEGNDSGWLPEAPAFTKVNIEKKVLINEIQIDSGGIGGTNDDWVEFYNPNDFDISLNGWSIQRSPESGKVYKKNFEEDDSISAKGYFLVVRNNASQELLDIADMTSSQIQLSEDSTVYLMNITAVVTENNFSAIVDKVGFGEKAFSPETNPAMNPPEEKSIERIQYKDTDDNSQDFEIKDKPTPTNSKKETIFEPALADSIWPMFQFNSQHISRSPYSGNNSEKPEFKELIISEGESNVFGVPVIGYNETIYLGAKITKGGKTKEGFFAFDSKGDEKWYYKTALSNGSPVLYEPDKTVYFFSDKEMYALNSKTGNLKWKKSFSFVDINQNPVISESGNLYFMAYCHLPDESSDFCLISLDKNGKEQWFYGFLKGELYTDIKLPENLELASISGRPAISPALSKEGTVYFSFNNTLFAFNSNGTEKWKRAFESKCKYFVCDIEVKTSSVGENGTVYLVVRGEQDFKGGSDSGILSCFHALNPENGQDIWQDKCYTALTDKPPAISSSGNIFISSGPALGGYGSITAYIYSFNPDGNLNWQKNIDGWADIGFPIVDSNEIVYKTFFEDYLMAFQSGDLKWSVKLKGAGKTVIMGKRGELIISGQKLYIINP